jgi:hypothetical protein
MPWSSADSRFGSSIVLGFTRHLSSPSLVWYSADPSSLTVGTRSGSALTTSPFPQDRTPAGPILLSLNLDRRTLAQAVSDSLATLHGSPAALRMELDSSTLATITNLTIEGDNEQRATRHEYHQRG